MKLTPELERKIADLDAPIFSPVCTFCIHKINWRKFEAFPDGIPLKIRTGENNHPTAYPNDQKIRFERVRVK